MVYKKYKTVFLVPLFLDNWGGRKTVCTQHRYRSSGTHWEIRCRR